MKFCSEKNFKRIIPAFFAALLGLQMVFSLRFPSVGSNDNWLPVDDYLPKFSAEGSDNFLLKTFFPLISSKYRLNSDVGEYLIMARDFSPEYLEGHQYLNRPLYPFLIFLISKALSPVVGTSYGILFGISIFLNFVLIFAAVVLFFSLLAKVFRAHAKIKAFKIAFLSALLLIFSPFVHGFLVQPMPEMLTLFGVVLALYLLYNYAQRPTLPKLVFFSFLAGIMMLGKMFFAIPLTILFLALYYRRLREGAVFTMCFAVPVIIWYLWTTRIWGIPYYAHEVQHWKMGIWVFSVFNLPLEQSIRIFVSAVPNFISAVFHSFIFLPAIFALIGAWRIEDKARSIFAYSFVFSVFVMVFLINFYLYRHTFMLFPIILPAAVIGIERFSDYLAKNSHNLRLVFQIASFAAIIYISSINIYRFYYYLN